MKWPGLSIPPCLASARYRKQFQQKTKTEPQTPIPKALDLKALDLEALDLEALDLEAQLDFKHSIHPAAPTVFTKVFQQMSCKNPHVQLVVSLIWSWPFLTRKAVAGKPERRHLSSTCLGGEPGRWLGGELNDEKPGRAPHELGHSTHVNDPEVGPLFHICLVEVAPSSPPLFARFVSICIQYVVFFSDLTSGCCILRGANLQIPHSPTIEASWKLRPRMCSATHYKLIIHTSKRGTTLASPNNEK